MDSKGTTNPGSDIQAKISSPDRTRSNIFLKNRTDVWRADDSHLEAVFRELKAIWKRRSQDGQTEYANGGRYLKGKREEIQMEALKGNTRELKEMWQKELSVIHVDNTLSAL